MIRTENIVKTYGSLQVLKGVSLKVEKGEIVSIIGPSGAGKTTLLQIIGTLLAPDQGKVYIGGTCVSGLKDKQLSDFRNRHVGFVFQFHQLLPEFTAEENVAMPALIARKDKGEALARARELIGYMGMEARSHHHPSEMSGGECQRIAVARALMNEPDVVLADEPTGSLDSKNKEELCRLFCDLRDKMGQTIIIVTHDPVLSAIADRVVRMEDGLIAG